LGRRKIGQAFIYYSKIVSKIMAIVTVEMGMKMIISPLIKPIFCKRVIMVYAFIFYILQAKASLFVILLFSLPIMEKQSTLSDVSRCECHLLLHKSTE